MKLLLIGGGGHALSCLDVIESTEKYTVVGYIDNQESPNLHAIGLSYLGTDHLLPNMVNRGFYALVAVGQIRTAEKRIKIFNDLKRLNINTPKIISSYACVSSRSAVGDGTIVMHGVVINSGALIGENCIINSMALIEHGVSIGAHCHISTGVRINGDVSIGEGSFIGSGAIINQGIKICAGAVVASGSIIKKDISCNFS